MRVCYLPKGLAKISLIFSTSCSVSSPALQGTLKHQQPTQRRGINGKHTNKVLPLVEVDLSDLEDEVGESSSDSLDDSHGEHDLSLTVDVCVLDSQNVSELVCLSQHDRRLQGQEVRRNQKRRRERKCVSEERVLTILLLL